MAEIKFSEWEKLDLRIGKILEVEDIENADKLYKLVVDVGEGKERTLVAGVKPYYKKKELEGKKCVVFCNLEAKELKGIKSEGMILAADEDGKPILITAEKDVGVGSRIR
jgi:methionine--tRNA ligase beta chain